MEYGSLEKSILIAASPAIVYEAVSNPEHVKNWWSDDASFEPTPGGCGTLTWSHAAMSSNGQEGQVSVVRLTVLEAVPGERFAFRWDYGRDEAPTPQNSLLVTFVITPHGGGSLLTVVEEGFRERGWEAAALQKYHERHDHGWAVHLASLGRYLQAVPTGGIR